MLLFGENLRCLRLANNLTEEELAKKINVSKIDILNWESNTDFPGDFILNQLSEIFNCNIDKLTCTKKKSSRNKLFIIFSSIFLIIILFVIIMLINFSSKKISNYIKEDSSTLLKIEIKTLLDDKVYIIEEDNLNDLLNNILNIEVKPSYFNKPLKGRTITTFNIYFETNKYELNGFYLKNTSKNKIYNFKDIDYGTLSIGDYIKI